MGTTARVLSGSKTKGSRATHTASVDAFRQGINAGSDRNYFGTALTPRMGAGPRFALFRGSNRVSDLNYDDTLRTADTPAKPKIVNYTASVAFIDSPATTPYAFDSSVGTTGDSFIRIFAADGQRCTLFPADGNGDPEITAKGNIRINFSATGSADDVARQFATQVNVALKGKVEALLGRDNRPVESPTKYSDADRPTLSSLDRPLSLNTCVFLTQKVAGPIGKRRISWQNMTNTAVNSSSVHSSISSEYLSASFFGSSEQIDVSFLGQEPAHKRVNFQRKEVNFGQPPTTPVDQPYHAVNSFNAVSFIEADERSMWPVNLFNAGNLPDRVFDGVIEPLDIRSVLLQMHNPRFEGHNVRGALVGAAASSILGSKEIQEVRIKGAPPTPPFLDSPLSFDLITETTVNTSSSPLAMQGYQNLDVQPTNPFLERAATDVVSDIQDFNNPMEISQVAAKDGFNAFVFGNFEKSFFRDSKSLVLSDAESCNFIMTSSDGTVRVYTGSELATTPVAQGGEWPPAGDLIVPFKVENPTGSFALIDGGTNIAHLGSDNESATVSGLVSAKFPASGSITTPLRFTRDYEPLSPDNGWAWDGGTGRRGEPWRWWDPGTPDVAVGAANSRFLVGLDGVYGVGTGADQARGTITSIINAINSPVRNHGRAPIRAERFVSGSFDGIKLTQIYEGEITAVLSSSEPGTALNGSNGWTVSDFNAPGWLPLSSGSGIGGERARASIFFKFRTIPVSGDSFTIVTCAGSRENRKNPQLYTSSSTFTFDDTITPPQGGVGNNAYKIGISGIDGYTANWWRDLSGAATAISLYNTLGHASGTLRVSHVPDIGTVHIEHVFGTPAGNTEVNATYMSELDKAFVITPFTSGSVSARTRDYGMRELIAAITGAYGHAGKITVTRKNTTAYPNTVLQFTQATGTTAGKDGNTVISSSIDGTTFNPGAGENPILNTQQFGRFSGPNRSRSSDMTRELSKLNFEDSGNLDVNIENANHGFYFDKKAGSIAYGDE